MTNTSNWLHRRITQAYSRTVILRDPLCRGGCTYYEYLGVIVFDKKLLDPAKYPTFFLDQVVDTWTTSTRHPMCSERGSLTIKGDVRGFVDNGLTIYNEINNLQNGWMAAGDVQCGCPGDGEDGLVGVGPHKGGAAPLWWKNPQYFGADSAQVVYDCCSSPPSNTALISSNSIKTTLLPPCLS